MGSRPDDEISNYGVTGTAVAVAAAAGVAALAVWGISKLFAGVAALAVWGISKLFAGVATLAVWGISKLFAGVATLAVWSSSSSSSGSVRDQNRNEVKWTRPKKGWLKLNTDASARKQHGDKTGPAAAGGVIRNDTGQWIVGFTSNLGVCDSTLAELEAVRDGLRLALERGFTKVEVETDSEAVVTLIKKHNLKDRHSMWSVAEECRGLLSRLGSDIGHVYRRGNGCANAMARIGIRQDERLIVWENIEDIPNNENVRNAYKADMNQYF